MLWCFLGIFGDKRGRNLNIFFNCGAGVGWSCAPLVVVFHRVHWSRGVPAFEDSGPAIGWLWSSGGVSHAFCPLPCFACGALHLNMALFRVLKAFLAGFGVRICVCMGLGFCVACGAFVRVWS